MKHAGFTLIELLMVIAIITFITAILVPLFRNSRLQSQALTCNSNLRQLIINMTIYHDENGTFPNAFNDSVYAHLNPPDGGHAGDHGYDYIGWWWFHYVTDYSRRELDNKEIILWCPSRDIEDINLNGNVLCANYGVNQSICKKTQRSGNNPDEFNGRPLNMNSIQRLSETLLIVDSGYSMINWWHVTNIPPEPLGNSIKDHAYIPGLKINKEKTIWPGLGRDAINGRHLKKTVNVGFVDGHVNQRNADDLYVEQTQEGYKNRYPLWQPSKITITNY